MRKLTSDAVEHDDPTGAMEWRRRAANAGDCPAMVELARTAAEQRDNGGAVKWWRRAADAGNGDAMYELGLHAQEDGCHDSAAERGTGPPTPATLTPPIRSAVRATPR